MKKEQLCPKDCPNRKPGCHNAQFCEIWARHEEAVKAERSARYNGDTIVRAYVRDNIRKVERRKNLRK